jgi:hypothetical protein
VFRKPSCLAAAQETSIRRSSMPGPRSLILSRVDLRFVRFVTRTVEPRGRVRWAAVGPLTSKDSPLAVALPWRSLPYQLAKPTSPFGIAWKTGGNGPRKAGSLASDFGDRAMRPATAQPKTSFLIQPPANVFPSRQHRLVACESNRVRGVWRNNPTETCRICQDAIGKG